MYLSAQGHLLRRASSLPRCPAQSVASSGRRLTSRPGPRPSRGCPPPRLPPGARSPPACVFRAASSLAEGCAESSIVFSNPLRGQSSRGVETLICTWDQASEWPPLEKGPRPSRHPPSTHTITRHCLKCVAGRYERCPQRHLLHGRSHCSALPGKPLGGRVRTGQIPFSFFFKF